MRLHISRTFDQRACGGKGESEGEEECPRRPEGSHRVSEATSLPDRGFREAQARKSRRSSSKPSDPAWARTRDLLLRRQSLYPAELRGRAPPLAQAGRKVIEPMLRPGRPPSSPDRRDSQADRRRKARRGPQHGIGSGGGRGPVEHPLRSGWAPPPTSSASFAGGGIEGRSHRCGRAACDARPRALGSGSPRRTWRGPRRWAEPRSACRGPMGQGCLRSGGPSPKRRRRRGWQASSPPTAPG